MNDEVLSMDEIKARYPDEWVLIGEFESDPTSQQVLRGKVVFHSAERDSLYRRLGELPRPVRCAVFFLGKPPKDMLFSLSPLWLLSAKRVVTGESDSVS